MIDFSPVFSSPSAMLWWIIPLFAMAALFRSHRFNVRIGELMVNIGASLLLDKHDYHLIRNVTIPDWGGSTRIDHIIVSRFGIFVVEVKPMKGSISGVASQKSWTQQQRRRSHAFQNPLHQTQKHTKTIAIVLGLEAEQLFSVVVFTGNNSFKSAMPGNVTRTGGYIPFIKSNTDLLLSGEEVQQAMQQLADGRLKPSIRTHRQHVQHVRNRTAAISDPEASTTCPQGISEAQQ